MEETPAPPDDLGSTSHTGPHPRQENSGTAHTDQPHFWDGPYHSGPPPQQPYTSAGFFHSIRSSGWFRAENRIIGGVCAGISAKTGWDLALVRALTVVVCVIAFPAVAVYALAWMLLPEQIDGRIHLESLVHGHWDVAQLGAFLMFLVSVPVVSLSVSAGSDLLVFFTLLGFTVLIACAIILVVQISKGADPTRRPSPRFYADQTSHRATPYAPIWPDPVAQMPPQPVPDAEASASHSPTEAETCSADPANWRELEQAPHQEPTPPDTSATANPLPQAPADPPSGPTLPYAGSPLQPHPAQGWNAPTNTWNTASPRFQPPQAFYPSHLPPQRKPLSGAASAMVFGLVLVVLAVTFAFMWNSSETHDTVSVAREAMVGGALCLVIVGTAICWAAIKDRSAVWLSVLAAVGLFLALPTGLVGMSTVNFEHYTASSTDLTPDITSETVENYTWKTDHITARISTQANLDLTDAPQHTKKTITVDTYLNNLTITVEEGQHVVIRAQDPYTIGSLKRVNTAASSITWVPELSTWQAQGHPITMPGSTEDNAIQVVLNDPIAVFSIDQVPDSHQRRSNTETPQSGDTRTPQSGALSDTAQSGSTPQSGSVPTPAPSITPRTKTAFQRSLITSGVNNEY